MPTPVEKLVEGTRFGPRCGKPSNMVQNCRVGSVGSKEESSACHWS